MPLRRQLLRPKERYLLRDDFNLPLPAGAVTGTFAAPGPGIRTVADTESKLSIAGGALTFAGGKASPGNGDPGIWYGAQARVAGRALFGNVNVASGTECMIGWDSAQSGVLRSGIDFFPTGAKINIIDNTANVAVAAISTATEYRAALIMRAAGYHFFIKNGAFANWTLVWVGTVDTQSPAYPGISNYNAAFTADNLRIPDRLYIPQPLAYDDFARADGALGSSASVGPDGQNTPQLAWTGATWAISSGKAVNTPTGTEQVTNGGFEGTYVGGVAPGWSLARGTASESATVHGGSAAQQLNNPAGNTGYIYQSSAALSLGVWLTISGWTRAVQGTGVFRTKKNLGSNLFQVAISGASYVQTFVTVRVVSAGVHDTEIYADTNASADTNQILIDDVSIKALSLPTLFATHAYSTTNILADVTLAAYTTGTQAGLVLRLDSAASPANFIIAYQDAGNVKIDACVAGTYTNLGTYASAYAAADSLRVSLDGNAWRLYKITSAGAATLLGSGTTAVTTGTLHGLFSTDASNTLDNWQCWARGNEGQYEGLSAL